MQELRQRFLLWALSLVAGSLIGYFLYEPILEVLIQPLKQPLFYSSPIGGFETVLGVSILFGFVVSIPVFIYHLIKFVEPVIGSISKKHIFTWIFASFMLAASGMLVAYYLLIPASLQFLGKFGSDQLKALISTRDYFSFVTKYMLGLAFLFQLPLCLFIINRFTPLSPRRLLKYFRYVVIASFVIAAILTPTPDIVNQAIMAAPLIGLYLISVAVIGVSSAYKKARYFKTELAQ